MSEIKKGDQPVVADVVGDEKVDTREGAKRYAALKALESGIKEELAILGRQLLSQGSRLGVSSFASDFGKITVAERKATFSVEDDVAYLQHFRDNGSEEFIQEYTEIDPAKLAEAIEVLKKHAPELLRTVEYVPEFLEVAFLNSLEMRKVKGSRPILDADGKQTMTEDLNPITGEIVEVPAVEEYEDIFAVQRVKDIVVQEDGSTVEQVTDVRRDFMKVNPGTTYLSYPASKEQKIAKAKAAAFFSEGDLSIAKAIPRKQIAAAPAPAPAVVVTEYAPASAPVVEEAPVAEAPKRRGARRAAAVDPTDEVVATAPKPVAETAPAVKRTPKPRARRGSTASLREQYEEGTGLTSD